MHRVSNWRTAIGAFAAACAIVVSTAVPGTAAPAPSGGEQTIIQYDCIPNYANWGGVTEAYRKKTGILIPPDMKGSSPSMAALEAERASPKADAAYYSGAIGYQAAAKGLHAAYRPQGWDRIPADLKDPEGKWWTVHLAHVAILVNTTALRGKPVPRSFADLLNPIYKGMIVYDDPRFNGTGFYTVAGMGTMLGGDADTGFAYLHKLDANILKYAKENSYNELVRGEIPIWINADGNGLKARYVDGAPIEVVIPAEGTVRMPLVMGLVEGAPHRKAAEAYFDWLLSEEAQALMAQSFFVPVIGTDGLPADLKAKFPPASAYQKARDIPLSEVAAQADALKKRWERDIDSGR
jgi:putative spermidine/putrescine transport system substrate-binding protein